MKKRRLLTLILALCMLCLPAAVTTAQAADKLPAPEFFKFHPGSSTLELSWNTVSGVDSYKVFQYDSDAKKYVAIQSGRDTICRVTGLKASTTYKFKVASYAKVDGKLVRQSTSAVQKCKTTAKPKSISISGNTSVKVGQTIHLKAAVNPAKYTDIEWSVSNGEGVAIEPSGTNCGITGMKKGTVTVTAKAGTKKASIRIEVKERKAGEVDAPPLQVVLYGGGKADFIIEDALIEPGSKGRCCVQFTTPSGTYELALYSIGKKLFCSLSKRGETTPAGMTPYDSIGECSYSYSGSQLTLSVNLEDFGIKDDLGKVTEFMLGNGAYDEDGCYSPENFTADEVVVVSGNQNH